MRIQCTPAYGADDLDPWDVKHWCSDRQYWVDSMRTDDPFLHLLWLRLCAIYDYGDD